MLIQVISGGQTGVDRAALDAALECGFERGGFCPKGRKAEDGRIPSCYPLEELEDEYYPARTRKNIEAADATLLICGNGKECPGTKLTRNYCHELSTRILEAPLGVSYTPRPIVVARWIRDNEIEVLNVAGSRESTNPGIYAKSKEFLVEVLNEVKKLSSEPPSE